MRLYTAAASRLFDQRAMDIFGIPGIVLMENAGRGAAEILVDGLRRRGKKGVVRILCGPGNNGGDGYVIARYLQKAGWKVQVLLASPPETLRGDAAIMWQIWERMACEAGDTEAWKPYWSAEDRALWRDKLPHSAAIVDALLGTGLSRDLQGHLKEIIEELAFCEGPLRFAVDLPSGLSADRGVPLPIAFRADITATFALHKVGLWQASAAPYVGDLRLVDLGTPAFLAESLPYAAESLEAESLRSKYRKRPLEGHKGTFGHLLVLAGSAGKTGAALLTSLASLRIGAGLCTLASDPRTVAALEGRVLEVMTESLPASSSDPGQLSEDAGVALASLSRGKTAIALGPGFSQALGRMELLKAAIEIPLPMVVDADGLNLLASERSLLLQRAAPTILTPHPGEMARLTGRSTQEIQSDRLAIAQDLAVGYRCFVILKGARTVIADPQGRLFLNPTGNPGMATAGSGDILTGLIGGLLAQGYPAEDAACLGVFLHGAAADRWVSKTSQASLIASDILHGLPDILGSWEAESFAEGSALHPHPVCHRAPPRT